jgi:hypothetical protein
MNVNSGVPGGIRTPTCCLEGMSLSTAWQRTATVERNSLSYHLQNGPERFPIHPYSQYARATSSEFSLSNSGSS